VRLGAPTVVHFCQDGGGAQSKWLSFAGVAIIPLRFDLIGLHFLMLLFCKALMYFLRFFRRQCFNNEEVDLIV